MDDPFFILASKIQTNHSRILANDPLNLNKRFPAPELKPSAHPDHHEELIILEKIQLSKV